MNLTDIFKGMLKFAGKNDVRFYLNTIHIIPRTDDVVIEASNGHTAARIFTTQPEIVDLFKSEMLLCRDALSWRFSLYVLVNTLIPPDNHDFVSSRRCSFTLNQAK